LQSKKNKQDEENISKDASRGDNLMSVKKAIEAEQELYSHLKVIKMQKNQEKRRPNKSKSLKA